MGVSENMGIPKSSILIGFSIIFTIHFGGVKTPIFGNIHVKVVKLQKTFAASPELGRTLNVVIFFPLTIPSVKQRHGCCASFEEVPRRFLCQAQRVVVNYGKLMGV